MKKIVSCSQMKNLDRHTIEVKKVPSLVLMEPFFVDIDEVMMYERTIPDEYINEEGNGVTEAFKEWCRPLIGEELPKMISFN